MNKPVERPAPSKEAAKEPEGKIEGELTLDDLQTVVGGAYAGPVINGKSYSPLKSRFKVDF
ncbi:MAG: hypothetical protein KIS92_23130 [Planctomycetota bacterium]|nr:hypothetical protein [Planctomycetota bacterium]